MPFWKNTDKGGKKKPPKSAVPRTAQQSILMQRMFEDGTCRVKPNYYTRTIQYQDINYQLAQQEDKTAIFEEWCSFLNFFDSSIKFELSFVNMATDSTEFEKSIRILRNATYMGYICYNKSKVNNYLEKKRINNLDEASFVYVKGNFEPIVSENLWHECERIRKSRISSLRLPDGETRRKGARTTKNLWVSKLRCRCGSSYRIFNWRKLKDGTPVFGYQCNMRTVNPTRSFVLEHNMTQQLSCDAISIPEWKLELMAKKIFEKVWGNQNKAILRACKMIESCQNGKATARMSAAPIQSKIEKIKKRKLNYAAMRADGELPREEYQALCKQADDEIARLEQELKALSPAPEPQTVSSDMKAIYDFLSQKVDVHGACLAPELIEQFVEVVTPIADYSYRWKLNTGCKKSKEERTDLMAVSEKPILTFTIDFEAAKRYREANKMPHQFRRVAWTDLTVEVYL